MANKLTESFGRMVTFLPFKTICKRKPHNSETAWTWEKGFLSPYVGWRPAFLPGTDHGIERTCLKSVAGDLDNHCAHVAGERFPRPILRCRRICLFSALALATGQIAERLLYCTRRCFKNTCTWEFQYVFLVVSGVVKNIVCGGRSQWGKGNAASVES